MGRPRKNKIAWLPPGIYFNKNRYYKRHPGGTEVKVADATATKHQVLRAVLGLPATESEVPRFRLRDLVAKYCVSDKFKALKPNTQQDAHTAFDFLLAFKTEAGTEFGDYNAEIITPGVMRKYLDKRGQTSKSRADKELAYLSTAYTWACQRDMVRCANPCKGVTKFKDGGRDRYVSDAEYQERFDYLGSIGRKDLQVMMELQYLCRFRGNEILKVTDSPEYITPEGVLVKRGKGSKTQLVLWSPRLKDAVAAARALPRRLPTPFLIVSACTGRPLTLAAFESAWGEAKRACAALGHKTDWTFHDLKAKGVSDFDGDAMARHEASGHKSMSMTQVYDRKIHSVKPTR